MPILYAHPDGVLRKFGTNVSSGSWGAASDTFAHRVTEASASNTGAGLGFVRDIPSLGLGLHTYRPLDPVADAYNGNMTTTAGQVVTNKIIYGWVDAHYQSVFRNCMIVGMASPPTPAFNSFRPLFKVLDHTPTANGQRAVLDCVTVEPQTKSAYWSEAIAPYGWEAHRVKAQGTTDILAARSNSAGNGLANVRAYDSWFGPVVQWDPDPVTDRSGQSYLGTHNDTVQFQGNTGGLEDIIFDGCTLVARMFMDIGQPSADPQYWPTPNSHSTMTAQKNTKDRVGFAFRFCRFYGGAPNEVNLGTDDASLSTIEFTDCLFERPGAPGVPANYPLRGLVIDTTFTRTLARNFYMDNGAAVTAQAG